MLEFTHDMGRRADGAHDLFDMVGFRNQPVTVPAGKLLENIREIQMPAQLRPSETIDTNDLRLTIEMETGTGKTYTYIKTMFELNRLYGWSKFIIVVPSIATREKLKEFKPLFTLLYSATHRAADIVNMIYRLDAMDAYNKKLVKKISVKGIEQKGTTATNGYVYLESVELSQGNPVARLGFDRRWPAG